MILEVCREHNISYNSDEWEGCPVCYFDSRSNKLQKEIDNTEKKDLESYNEGVVYGRKQMYDEVIKKLGTFINEDFRGIEELKP